MNNKKYLVTIIIAAIIPTLHWLLLEIWSRDHDKPALFNGLELDVDGTGEATIVWYDFGWDNFFLEFVTCFLCFIALLKVAHKLKKQNEKKLSLN
ncbi:hypothetical protein [Paenibacillus glycanilyticus]|uniref:Uncharacterized protein n=1 Tax=Paenibacillus glycanilyticus TaxID=126569 RepID=A0ABQ6GAS8_9BACL|nr:hypothetical protein [Paenibacillus glycanilyticus]GLX66157.1 hypothetical protein MU1_05010 [Paenibacillus glycanilyticus]